MVPERKIIHIDADAFYASVEMRENPKLAQIPLAVGGSPQGRGVISTCNYLARSFGVRSAMPSSHALRLCPDLQFVRPNFELYRQVSNQMRAIFLRFTELIEPLSLDEAYLDVTDSDMLQGSATRMAQSIQEMVSREINITVSAGVAPNKFLAKVASDWKKPSGLFVIPPSEVDRFVKSLPVNKINGVGKVTYKKLRDLGIETCGDIQAMDSDLLHRKFGKYGSRLLELSQGIDNNPVTTNRIRKSISVEHTYDEDLSDQHAVFQKLPKVYDELSERLNKYEQRVPNAMNRLHKRFVKLKFNDFTQTTLEHTLKVGEPWSEIEQFKEMLDQAWRRAEKPVRLIGVGLRFKTPKSAEFVTQLDLFDEKH